jgi:DNA modification methylase
MTLCQIVTGDALEVLSGMQAESVQCCVTSPPYWGLRDYGVSGQLGLEATPAAYVVRLVEVLREVRRVLRKDGVLWLNMGDSYANPGHYKGNPGDVGNIGRPRIADKGDVPQRSKSGNGLKNKDLCGIPWRVAFALQADGWWLRQDVIWSKPNPMPESVTDRCTRAHEYLFMFTRSARYFYDAHAIRQPDKGRDHTRNVLDGQRSLDPSNGLMPPHRGLRTTEGRNGLGANARSVWTIATSPFPGAHFATFPPELPRRCILAASRVGDLVLDPFAGAGTTGLVAHQLQRAFVGIELNPAYADIARRRIRGNAPLFIGAE